LTLTLTDALYVRIKYLSRSKKDLSTRLIGIGIDPSKELHAYGIRWLRHFKMPFDSGDFQLND
jgi:hypothetical protein